MTLAETGTRALIGAAIGSTADRDEASLARRLLPLLRPGMLLPPDHHPAGRQHQGRTARNAALGPQAIPCTVQAACLTWYRASYQYVIADFGGRRLLGR
jgi:hypothetical protein